MAVSYFGVLSSFDHNVQSWKVYKSRITLWFIANNINHVSDAAGVKRRALLLSALSEGTYKLATDLALPKEVQDVPYEDILALLDAHFTPKHIGFSARHKFYAAIQQPAESHTQWAARLRGLTANCGFSNLEEAVRDRFVMGMLPGIEKEEIYGKDLASLPLSTAVELAENIQCARAVAACAAAATSVGAIAPTDASVNMGQHCKQSAGVISSEKVKCSSCGNFDYKTPECHRSDYSGKKVNLVVSAETDESDDGELYHIRSFTGEPMVEYIELNGVSLKFEIDSGSAVTVISETGYRRHYSMISLSPSKKKLLGYTGEKIHCLGVMSQSQISYGGVTRAIDVYVVRGGGPALLGRDFISKFNLELAPVKFCKLSISIEQLQAQYAKIFSETLGTFKKYQIKLFLKENSKPIFFKARPIAFALREKVTQEIDRLVDLGVLRPVDHSDYASPIVPVLKRNGSVRICADYAVTINKQLVVEQYLYYYHCSLYPTET